MPNKPETADALQCIMQPKRLEAHHLVAFRKRYKLTKGRIASILGVNNSTWYRWESGKGIIPLWLFLALKPVAEGLQRLEQIVQDAPTE